MMKIGVVKPIAVMSAMVMNGMATNHSTRPSVCTAPRVNWPATLTGQYATMPLRATSGSITARPIR